MVHAFSQLDEFFILDTESGSLYCVDETAYIVARVRYGNSSEAERAAYDALDEGERNSVLEEFTALESEGVLDSVTENPVTEVVNHGVIKAMCLNICHDCNLRCKYCFADEGKYHGERMRMTFETAKRALDFLIESSKNRKNLEVDFFGGEPLMNFDVVKQAVLYGRQREQQTGKKFKFTITTNAVSLKDDDIAFINEHMSNVVLSIDGRKAVHNRVRPNAAGEGSYDAALNNALKLRAARQDKEYYVRGTFTALNTDFSEDAMALADAGFDQISLEPVVLDAAHPLALTEADLPVLIEQYRVLSRKYFDRLGTEKAFNYFHFNIDLGGGPCERKRLTGCGAGVEYVAVAVNGDLYPCHQFVGDPNYLMGNVSTGVTNHAIGETFCTVNINTKDDCKKCWARYYCSGGCNANAVHFSGDIMQPMPLMCELSRARIECALALKAKTANNLE